MRTYIIQNTENAQFWHSAKGWQCDIADGEAIPKEDLHLHGDELTLNQGYKISFIRIMYLEVGSEVKAEDINDLVMEHRFTLTKMTDWVIKANSFVGVGLISLGEDMKKYIQDKIEPNPNFD